MQLQLDKPMCPYCGEHNGHPDGVEMEPAKGYTINDNGAKEWIFWHTCPVCHNMSPHERSREKALISALRHFHPLQKPLTLEEVKRHIEEGNERPLRIEFHAAKRPYFADTTFYPLWRGHDNIRALIRHEDQYNAEFRFWWEDPTAEECAAAKWEET